MRRSATAILLGLLLVAAGGQAAWLSAGGQQGAARVTIIEQGITGTTFEVEVPGIEVTPVLEDGRQYNRVEVPGQVMAILEEGRPQVPKVAVLLGIPTGARVSTRVLDIETVGFELA